MVKGYLATATPPDRACGGQHQLKVHMVLDMLSSPFLYQLIYSSPLLLIN